MRFRILTLFFIASLAVPGFSQVEVLTQHNDHYRTGSNPLETKLTPANVNPVQFGLLYSLPVDGQIYAQPLVAYNVKNDPKGPRNLAYLCTAHNTVYCYDISAATHPLVWSVNLGPSVPSGDVGSYDVYPEIGIISTPVIDKGYNALYVVAKTETIDGQGNRVFATKLHALSLFNGAELKFSPVTISGQVYGSAPDAVNGFVPFDPQTQMNRPGLLLDHNTLYLGFASHGDNGPYHGWVFAYVAGKLSQCGIYCTTPDGDPSYYLPSGAGGVWQAGQGLASDDFGLIYMMSGNGAFSHNPSGRQTGNSIFSLVHKQLKLALAKFFTPHDSDNMNWGDADLGSAGVVLVPGTNLVMGGGKTGDFFVVDKTNMGGYDPNADHILQRFYASAYGLFSTPVVWQGPNGWVCYVGGQGDLVREYAVTSTGLNQNELSASTSYAPWPGSGLSVSSNGVKTPIVWANSNRGDGYGILRAFNGNNLGQELWDSEMSPAYSEGVYNKFTVPTIANGLVLIGTNSMKVDVYGVSQGGNIQIPLTTKPYDGGLASRKVVRRHVQKKPAP